MYEVQTRPPSNALKCTEAPENTTQNAWRSEQQGGPGAQEAPQREGAPEVHEVQHGGTRGELREGPQTHRATHLHEVQHLGVQRKLGCALETSGSRSSDGSGPSKTTASEKFYARQHSVA